MHSFRENSAPGLAIYVRERQPPACYTKASMAETAGEGEERIRMEAYAVALILTTALLAVSLWVVHSGVGLA